jgi:hypothetical protein
MRSAFPLAGWLVVAVFGVSALLVASAAACADEIIDRVLAVAGDAVILASDVRAARDLGLVPPTGAADPDRAVLTSLVDRALMLDEVDRYAPPEPSTADIDRAFAEIRDRAGSLNALNAILAKAGMDERELREVLRQNLRIRNYLTQRFSGDSPERVQSAIGAWVLGLRRRADIVDLYQHDEPARR